MSFVHVLSIGATLALCVAPVLLLRGRDRAGASAGREEAAPPAIIRNAWVASALRLGVFVPLFALGAAGDLWPAIAGAFGFGAGLSLLAVIRQPPVPGLPATLHARMAQACGGAVTVRMAVATATVVGLVGLAGAEAAALVAVARPLLGEGAAIGSFLALLALATLLAASAGPSGTRYAAQALLGVTYLGLFGSAAFLLYLNASALNPLPPSGAFALVALAIACLAIPIYRQGKYMETPPLVAPEEPSGWRRTAGGWVKRLLKLANIVVSVLAVLALVIAGMEFYFLGLPGTLQNGLAALGEAPRLPALGLAAIALLALTYPLVDATGWQSVAALVGSARATGQNATGAPVTRPIRMVAGETAGLVIVLAAFGAIAALAADLPPGAAGMPDLVGQLVLYDNQITHAGLTLLLVGAFAMALSTMSMALATALTSIRSDILPAMPIGARDPDGAGSADRAAIGFVATVAILVAAIWIASGVVSSGGVDARFFAVALAFACLQVSLLPLVLAQLRGVRLPGGAAGLVVLGGGIAGSLGAVAVHVATGDVVWLWLAVPICLVSGFVLRVAATLRSRALTPPH